MPQTVSTVSLQDIDSSFFSFYKLKQKLHQQCVQYFIAPKTCLHTIYVFGVIFILPVLISDFDPLSSSSSTARVMDLVPFCQTGAIKESQIEFLACNADVQKACTGLRNTEGS